MFGTGSSQCIKSDIIEDWRRLDVAIARLGKPQSAYFRLARR